MKTMILSLVLIATAPSAFAGSGWTQLHCASESGRTRIDAQLPGEIQSARIKITVDGKSQDYLDPNFVDALNLNGRNPDREFPGYQMTRISTTSTRSDFDVVASEDGRHGEAVYLVLRSVGTVHSQ